MEIMLTSLSPVAFRNDERLNMLKAFVIGFIFIALFSFYGNVNETISGWFGNSKADLIEKNVTLDKDNKQLIEINKEIEQDRKVDNEIAKEQIKDIVDLQETKKKTADQVAKKKKATQVKSDTIQSSDKTEAEKDVEHATMIIEDIWASHCEVFTCVQGKSNV